MILTLSRAVVESIRAEGASSYPHECCGLLIGTIDESGKHGLAIHRVENVWTAEIPLTASEGDHSLRDRFYIPPKAYLQADRAARAQNLDLIGCYHSHPDDRAVLSERDRVGAAGVGGGPGFSFVVISVRDTIPGDISSSTLSIDGARWLPETLVIEE